ncbi:uncharacterized protein EI97DRAFT_462659 [Westerdykella ornata]|uniref:Uncharacterized protein n=1 Tax=Westerdykella ornata TaxID=318751 RepID=A0A6A6J8S9_WESOR|nr:uncharacterized protein EI97DRAFT_462659 [Westerdykella ornata]KAF2271609.1 hypothetical protein EI97DRAFT_462659 [Westerdykella ornata]
MRSGLSTAFSLLLVVTCIDAAPYDFNFLDNYRRPAPSPEDGPPASANASRNKALLPAQICAIVGAYVLTVLIWGVLLLTVGKNMRRKAVTAPKALELELVTARPSGRTPASPASARSATSWFKRGFRPKSNIDSAIGSTESPVVQSPASFDQKVIEADRDRAQAEMERLYAAVMEHDRKKSYSQISNDETELKERRPPRIDTSRASVSYSNPASPVRAIYPPGYHSGAPTAPLPRDRERLRDQPPASPRSILSKKSTTSNASTSTNKARFNLKNLRISSPMHNNTHTKYPDQGSDDEARTPLSPRFHYPGARTPSQQNSPTTPGDLDAYEQLDEVQPLPNPAPQRLNSYSSDAPSSNNKSPSRSATAGTTSNALPLRGYTEPLKSPDLRTTVLDRRMDNLSLASPKTGVPFTPYSPYMPFTPITPVTPHLVTRKERKSRQGRRMVGREKEELVQSPKEIFGDAW